MPEFLSETSTSQLVDWTESLIEQLGTIAVEMFNRAAQNDIEALAHLLRHMDAQSAVTIQNKIAALQTKLGPGNSAEVQPPADHPHPEGEGRGEGTSR